MIIKVSIFLLFLLFSGQLRADSDSPVVSQHAMVVTSQRLATDVGLQILKEGGNAIDAAVAVGYALAVVEPCCGNLGGGGFLLFRKKNGQAYFLNFREKAPEHLFPQLFIKKDGSIDGVKLTNSYLASGVPGTVMGLNSALKKFGTMSLPQVIAPAIRLAKEGFKLDSTNGQQFQSLTSLNIDENVKRNFTRNGQPYRAGDLFVQRELANTLMKIAKNGDQAFYQGDIAKKIVQDSDSRGGVFTLKDFENYQIKWQKPLVCNYHGYEIMSGSLPSSGGVTLCEMLQILEHFPLANETFHSLAAAQYMIETMRFAYSDRIKALGDPDFVKDLTADLLAPEHIEMMVADIKNSGKAPITTCTLPSSVVEKPQTTHYSIIDQHGDAVAVTYTINDFFGSRISAEDTGFLLNDEMDDFAIIPNKPNHPSSVAGGAANLMAPNKRSLSSVAPTIVSKSSQTVLVTGSPGGATIPTTVLQVLVNVLDFRDNVQRAVNASRFHNQCIPDFVYTEPQAFSAEVTNKLVQEGYYLIANGPFNHPIWGAAESIWRDPVTGSLYGANDIRRPDGLAAGF